MDKNILYYAGMASVISYLLADIIGGIITPNYSYVVNAVSELIQAGAENRMLISQFLFLSSIMGILFALGIISHYPYIRLTIDTFFHVNTGIITTYL